MDKINVEYPSGKYEVLQIEYYYKIHSLIHDKTIIKMIK